MARVPAVTRESIPENQRASFDELVQERGEIPTGGPGSVMLNAPDVAKRALDLALFLRTHAPAARRAGLRDDIVNALRDRKELPNLAADESAVVNYGREFFRTHRVSQATFDAALGQFGVLGLTELTNLLGCYAMLAFNVNAFGVELPEGRTEEALPI